MSTTQTVCNVYNKCINTFENRYIMHTQFRIQCLLKYLDKLDISMADLYSKYRSILFAPISFQAHENRSFHTQNECIKGNRFTKLRRHDRTLQKRAAEIHPLILYFFLM